MPKVTHAPRPRAPKEVGRTPTGRGPAAPDPTPNQAPGWKPAPKQREVKGAAAIAAPAEPKRVQHGPVNELERMGAVIVANPDEFGPTVELHESVAKGLGPGVRLLSVAGEGYTVPDGARRLSLKADSPWTRDFAPTFVRTRDGTLEAVEFKYGYRAADGVAKELATKLGVPVREVPLVIEGGNLLADKGRLFITTAALKKNKGLTKEQVEAQLKEALHVDAVEWMEPLPKEATGHIDLYVKQAGPNLMFVSDTGFPEQKAVMDAAARRFEALGYEVRRVMNPSFAPRDPEEDPSWGPTLSYANALIVNGKAFVPQYDNDLWRTIGGDVVAKHDRLALDAYAAAGLQVVGVPAADLIQFQGSVHCMTNTIPAELDASKLFT